MPAAKRKNMPTNKRKKTSTKRKTTAKKTTATKSKALKGVKAKFTKTQIVTQIAEQNELTKKQVSGVLDSLSDMIEQHVKKRSVGEFVLPGLLKIQTVKKPARKARKGINPFTKQEMMFKAKPASTTVKVRALKKLKEMAK